MSLADVQRRVGATPDGVWGPKTEAAIMAALDRATPAAEPSAHGIAAVVAAQPVATRPIEGIVIHCTATQEGRDYHVDDVRAWHKAQGWSDIGYHWLAALDGTVEPGRPEARVGSHVKEANTGTLGVVYVGGVDGVMSPKDTRTPAQKEALMALCRALIAKYPTIKWIKGHNDFTNAKACPSFKVGNDPLGQLV